MSAIGQEPEAGGGEAAAAAGEGESQGPDIGAMLGEFGTRLDELGTQIQGITQAPPEPEGAGEEEGEEDGEFDLPEFGVEDFDEDGLIKPEAQSREIARLVQQGVQDQMAPHLEERAWERRDQEADALEERYPDLADEKTQAKYLTMAQQEAQRLGQPALAIEPKFLETVYLADQARQKAGDEIPAGSRQEVTVERGGVAGGGSADGPGDDGDRIVALAKTRHHRVGS
jgi:hypothetical protein